MAHQGGPAGAQYPAGGQVLDRPGEQRQVALLLPGDRADPVLADHRRAAEVPVHLDLDERVVGVAYPDRRDHVLRAFAERLQRPPGGRHRRAQDGAEQQPDEVDDECGEVDREQDQRRYPDLAGVGLLHLGDLAHDDAAAGYLDGGLRGAGHRGSLLSSMLSDL